MAILARRGSIPGHQAVPAVAGGPVAPRVAIAAHAPAGRRARNRVQERSRASPPDLPLEENQTHADS
jgi:hypothetical protein